MKKPNVCSSIPAAILAGGMGTRLRSAVADCPKPLAPVGGRPFIAYLLDQLAQASCQRVVLLTGYRAAQVQQHAVPARDRDDSQVGDGWSVLHGVFGGVINGGDRGHQAQERKLSFKSLAPD